MAFKIKFRTQIFFGITLFFFVLTKNIFHIFFLIFDESMLINENLFPKSIKNTQKKKNKKQKTKQNKKQIHNYYCQLSPTELSSLSFPLPTLLLSPFHLYKISIIMLQKPKKNPLPFSRFQLNIEKKIIFIRKNNFHLNILRVCLISNFFTETENFLLKVLQIKVKVS